MSNSSSSQPLVNEEGPFIYSVNLELLSDLERKSYATNILHCFSAVRNEWSTDEELAVYYEKFRPGTTRSSVVNVRENKQDWNRKTKKVDVGDDHSEVPADGCVYTTERHRVCKRTVKKTETIEATEGEESVEKSRDVEQSRIHPAFAAVIFSESSTPVSKISAVPIRNFKRKRMEIPMDEEEDENVKRLKIETTIQKRRIAKLKKQLTASRKLLDEMRETEKMIMDLDTQVKEHESVLRRSLKGKPPKPVIAAEKRKRGEVTTDHESDEESASEREVEEKVVKKPKTVRKEEVSGTTSTKARGLSEPSDDDLFSSDDEEMDTRAATSSGSQEY